MEHAQVLASKVLASKVLASKVMVSKVMASKRDWAFSPAGYCRFFLHGTLLAAAMAPFLLAHAGAALFDLPNAMARVGIGLRLWENPDGSPFYTQSFKLIPNMAVDLFGLAAGRWLGAEMAVNLFVALSIAIFYLAIQSLRTVLFGSASVVIGALSVFAIYSFALRWGFINYFFASGLMILAVASLERQLKSGSRTFVVHQTALLAVIYLSSLFAALLYLVYAGVRLLPIVAGHALRRDWSGFARLATVHGAGPATVMALFVFGTAAPPWPQQGTVWEWFAKLEAVAMLFSFRAEPFELTLAVVASAAGAALICRARLAPSQAPALLAVVAVFVLMPIALKGVYFADMRLPGTIAGLLLAGVQVRPARLIYPRLAMAAGAVLVLAGLLKPAAMWLQVRPVLDARLALPALFAEVPQGSIVAIHGVNSKANIGGLRAWHLPLIQLARGEYFFPEVFPNYFVDFRLPTPIPTNENDEVAINTELLCSGMTHVVLIGDTRQWPAVLPADVLHREGNLTMVRVRRGGTSDDPNVADAAATCAGGPASQPGGRISMPADHRGGAGPL
jgi:hypothetical protein